MYLPMRVIFGASYRKYMSFKADALNMSREEFERVYAEFQRSPLLDRPTDLNEACVDRILRDVAAYKRVLDVGCGQGYLAGRMAEVVQHVTGTDVYLDPRLEEHCPRVECKRSNLEKLAFEDRSFDVVVSTHTLEHVRNIEQAVAEMRRVARSLIIIVVPKERPYRYTLNLHLHFFPYLESLLLAVKPASGDYACCELGGDIYYVERLNRSGPGEQAESPCAVGEEGSRL